MPSKSVLIAQAFSKTGVLSTVVDSAPSVNTGQLEVATSADLPDTGNTQGDFAFVQSTNRLYIWNGSGWYNIALINTTPTWDAGGQPAGSYVLDADSPQDATVITLAASDPEGIPINYTYVTSGQMDSIATISQDSSVFTITPKTSTQVPDGGTGSITFRATDGVNILPQVSSFTLNFVNIIDDSKHTTLLATATGTSDNNNITDASSNNHTITVNGDAYAGTFSPYRHGGYSTYFPDTDGNAYVSANSSDYALGSGALTVSAWIYIDNNTQQQTIIDNQTGSGAGWYLKIWPGQLIRVHNQSSYIFNISNSDAPTAVNEWIHLCWTRDGSGNNKLFLNGTQVGTTVTDTTNFTAQGCKLGETYQGVNDLKGYIKDVHIVAGYANEPTISSIATAVTSGTGTVFLGCSGPDFLERSSSPKTITINSNNIFIRPFSPYDNLEYSVTDHGGSVYFGGGTREHLSTSLPAFGTQDFEVEFWIYGGALTSSTWYTLFSRDYNVNGSFRIYCAGGAHLDKFIYIANGTEYNYTSAGKIRDNVWNHILLSRVSGTAKWFINGIEDTSWSDSENMTSTATLYIGDTGADETSNSSYPFVGYMSDIAIRMGGSGYRTSSFVPPTTSLSSTGAELHIKGTDASIIDKSQGSNLKLIGNTTGSTTQVKFANTKSMYFDASGDYISISDDEAYGFGTGDWTIETWLYCTKTGGFNAIFDTRVGTGTETGSFGLGMHNTGRVQLFSGGAFYYPTDTLSFNTWQHFAVVKNSGTTTMYFNGTAASTTYSDSRNYGSSQPVQIGKDDTTSNYFGGYMQDFRITKDLARYTANFTPPSAPLEG